MLGHFSKSLPNGENGQLYCRAPPPLHARVSGVERPLNSKSFKDPIMCSALRPCPNHRLFPLSQIPDMPLLFPLAKGHRVRLSVLLCAHRHPLSAVFQCSFHFPKTNLGPRPSKTVTPLMGESFKCVCMRGM